MKNVKKLLTLVVVLSTFFALAMVPSYAATGTTGSVQWEYNNGTLWISGEGNMADYPSWRYTPWYDYAYDIKDIKIGNGVKHIGDCAFEGCYYADHISIGKDVESIGYCAFYQATWHSTGVNLVIPESVTSIGDYAFQQCYGLENVWIEGNVNKETTIGTGAFKESGIYNLAIGSPAAKEQSITLGYEAFENCENLENLFLSRAIKSIDEQAFCDIATKNSSAGSFFGGYTVSSDACKLYYGGSSEQFNKITIGSWNDYIVNNTKNWLTDVYDEHSEGTTKWLEKKSDWVFSSVPFEFPDRIDDYDLGRTFNGAASVFSQGSLWVIVGIAVVAVAVIAVIVTKKKKKAI